MATICDTRIQIFYINNEIVFKASQNLYIHRELEIENFRDSNTFFLCSISKKVKKEKIYTKITYETFLFFGLEYIKCIFQFVSTVISPNTVNFTVETFKEHL